MDYKVSEIFTSFQGEGLWMGTKSFFVRMFGCPVKCDFCDTKNSWNTNDFFLEDEKSLTQKAIVSASEIVIITGGEPCVQNLNPLVDSLKKSNIKSHIETAGICEKNCNFDWLTLSPKLNFPPHISFLESADELKFVISDISQMTLYSDFAIKAKNAKAIWLQPESSKSNDNKLLQDIASFVEVNGGIFRAGIQLHKIYSIK